MPSCVAASLSSLREDASGLWGVVGPTARSSGASARGGYVARVADLRSSRIPPGLRAVQLRDDLASASTTRSMTMLITRIATRVTAVAGSSTSVVNAKVTSTVTVLTMPSSRIAAVRAGLAPHPQVCPGDQREHAQRDRTADRRDGAQVEADGEDDRDHGSEQDARRAHVPRHVARARAGTGASTPCPRTAQLRGRALRSLRPEVANRAVTVISQ